MTTESKSTKDAPEKHDPVVIDPEQVALDASTSSLRAFVDSDQPTRMSDDAYVGIIVAARRFNDGDGDIAAVQSELDRVFGAGKINAADVAAGPPEA